jgi:hypothetical protein
LGVFWLGLFLFLGFGASLHVRAQEEEQDWVTPVNLSNTGAAKDPAIAIGADGEIHE